MCQAIKALSPITLPIRADPDPVGTELMGKAWNHAYPVDWLVLRSVILRVVADYPRSQLGSQRLLPDETACARNLACTGSPGPPNWRRCPTGAFSKARKEIQFYGIR
jgi:hypothetical protein